MNLKYELVNYKGNLYCVYRKIEETKVIPEKVNDLKDYWRCDTVLRKNGILYFLNQIIDAEIIEEVDL